MDDATSVPSSDLTDSPPLNVDSSSPRRLKTAGSSSRKSELHSSKSSREDVDDKKKKKKKKKDDLGGHTISFWGGVGIFVNNITGPAMVLFPQLYQSSGWLISTLTIVFVTIVCIICCLMLVESMSLIPGNAKLTKRVEYTTIAKHYLSNRMYWLTQLIFQLSLMAFLITSIVQSIQVFDFMFVNLAGRSCAVPELWPTPGFHCPDPVENYVTPFGDMYLIPLSWWITAALTIPLGFANLDDNVIVQNGAFVLLWSILFLWIVFSGINGLDSSYVPAVGSDQSMLIGTILFNYGVMSSVPSWICEKKPQVSIHNNFYVSVSLSSAIFILLGWIGGATFAATAYSGSQTFLNLSLNFNSKIAVIAYYTFPVVVNLTGIPIFSIFARYNLIKEKVCGPKMASFIGVILPWLVSIYLYTGSGYQTLVNYGGIVLNSYVNFILPLILYVLALYRYGGKAKAREEEYLRKEEEMKKLMEELEIHTTVGVEVAKDSSDSDREIRNDNVPPRSANSTTTMGSDGGERTPMAVSRNTTGSQPEWETSDAPVVNDPNEGKVPVFTICSVPPYSPPPNPFILPPNSSTYEMIVHVLSFPYTSLSYLLFHRLSQRVLSSPESTKLCIVYYSLLLPLILIAAFVFAMSFSLSEVVSVVSLEPMSTGALFAAPLFVLPFIIYFVKKVERMDEVALAKASFAGQLESFRRTSGAEAAEKDTMKATRTGGGMVFRWDTVTHNNSIFMKSLEANATSIGNGTDGKGEVQGAAQMDMVVGIHDELPTGVSLPPSSLPQKASLSAGSDGGITAALSTAPLPLSDLPSPKSPIPPTHRPHPHQHQINPLLSPLVLFRSLSILSFQSSLFLLSVIFSLPFFVFSLAAPRDQIPRTYTLVTGDGILLVLFCLFIECAIVAILFVADSLVFQMKSLLVKRYLWGIGGAVFVAIIFADYLPGIANEGC